MKFRPKHRPKPELNLIPMIDVLIVLLIFLVLTTTFSREAALRIRLPEASAQADANDKGIHLQIDAQGRYAVNGRTLPNTLPETLKQALREAAGEQRDPRVTIAADKAAQHHAVMQALDAAGQLGFVHISFAAKTAAR